MMFRECRNKMLKKWGNAFFTTCSSFSKFLFSSYNGLKALFSFLNLMIFCNIFLPSVCNIVPPFQHSTSPWIAHINLWTKWSYSEFRMQNFNFPFQGEVENSNLSFQPCALQFAAEMQNYVWMAWNGESFLRIITKQCKIIKLERECIMWDAMKLGLWILSILLSTSIVFTSN